jgi:hypothetical protein
MGFRATLVFLVESEAKASQVGPNGETKCTIWQNVFQISFGDITRFEKLVTPRYDTFKYPSSSRAAIAVFSCIFPVTVSVDWEKESNWLVPEIIIEKFIQETFGGGVYAENFIPFNGFSEISIDRDKKIKKHNQVVKLPFLEQLKELYESEPYFYPVFTWVESEKIARAITHARECRSIEWQTIEEDDYALAIAEGWRVHIERFAELNTRACIVMA